LEPESRARKIPHLYYYFNFRDESTQTCENFLRSILSQLLYFLPDIPPAINELHKQCNLGKHRPSVRDMTDCFIAVVNTVDEAWLFGDAFDECVTWNDLWHFLSTAAKSRCPGLRFIFTSRPEGYIRDAVGSLGIPSLDLDCDGINRDIVTYVSESLTNDVRFIRTPPKGKDLIRESLIPRAGGMYVSRQSYWSDIQTMNRFRWIALQLDTVSRCRSVKDLRCALYSLPPSLDETYRRILESIDMEEEPHVRRILQWLCFSKRPLCVEEIAVIYEVGDRIQPAFASDDDFFHVEDIIDICRGLLSLSLYQNYHSFRYDDKQQCFFPISTVKILNHTTSTFFGQGVSPIPALRILGC
jgi:ankyrin repeat domain-containing protein 50